MKKTESMVFKERERERERVDATHRARGRLIDRASEGKGQRN
jgi:hypothetical protein